VAARTPLGRSIVVGTVGDASSTAAVRVAHLLAARDGGEVRAIAAVAPFPHAAVTSFSITPPPLMDEENRRATLASVARQLRELGATEASARAVMGWPSEAVVTAANERNASLIVVGLGHHRAIDRLLGHETAVSIARHATVPVLAVTARCTALPERVLVGIDFTESSRRAAELAARLIQPAGEIVLAHVPPFAAFQRKGGGESWVDVYMTGAEDRLEEERAMLAERTGRRVRALLANGEPGEQLLKLARKMCCDTIAVGAHAQGFVDRVLLGSIATRVLRAASCSVLVAPRWR
jgi:nucleotide-binding universal stress UspA family protein